MPLEIQVGDKVLLKLTPQIQKKISSKRVQRGLIPKYDGSSQINKEDQCCCIQVELPDRLKIHPFYMSFLKSFHEDQDPIECNTSMHYQLFKSNLIERFIGSQIIRLWEYTKRIEEFITQSIGKGLEKVKLAGEEIQSYGNLKMQHRSICKLSWRGHQLYLIRVVCQHPNHVDAGLRPHGVAPCNHDCLQHQGPTR